jgi:2-polyprenyl-3-methyl-5-hydroxy-6-metoxy-1,4-benzoquinol methylase
VTASEKAALESGHCWCGAAERVVRFRTKKFGLLGCPACGTSQIDPPPIGNEEEAAGFYTDFYEDGEVEEDAAAESPPGRSSRFWRVAERVPSLDTAGRSVLDFGSGEGTLCGELAAAGWASVTGIDVSRSRVARARAAHPGVVFDDRGSDALATRSGAFDLVILDNVIEHLSDPVGVLAQLRQTLAPGGRIVLITPNLESGRFRLLGRRWTPELSPHAHIFLFTARSLSRLAARAGFQAREVGDFLLPLRYGMAVRGLLQTRNVKEAVWRLGQETGGLWGRVIGSGEMVYLVGERTA